MTLALPGSENRTRISHTVLEIFDRKHIALNALFLHYSLELPFGRIYQLARSNRSAFEIPGCNDYNISETIKTTETPFAPFGSVTLDLGHSENGTWISLTVSEIFDRKHIALNAIFLYSSSLLLLSHTNSFDGFLILLEQFFVKMENSWCWRLQYLWNDHNYRDVVWNSW